MSSIYEKTKKFVEQVGVLKNGPTTMESVFNCIMNTNENKIAVFYYDENGKVAKYKYKDVRKNAYSFGNAIANKLSSLEKNTPVVLKMANGPHWTEVFWGILMSGHKPLLIDARTSQEGSQNLINQSKAVAIITDDGNEYSTLKFSLADISSGVSSNSFIPTWENEVIFCSSGTTGDVKLMVFNGANICAQIYSSFNLAEKSLDIITPYCKGQMRVLAMIPFHHIFGFATLILWYQFYGGMIVFPRSSAANEIIGACQKSKITHVFSVPLFWDSLALSFERKVALMDDSKKALISKMIDYNNHKIDKNDAGLAASKSVKKSVQKNLLGTKVRFCISGGGYLNSKTLETINGIGYSLNNGFGMTEVGVTSVELSPDVTDRLKGSIGAPFLGVQYKIKKDNDGENGELLIKSDVIHVREIIGGVEKKTAVDDEGYFSSGDIGGVDENGNYYIRGRIKDIIINADGENVFPDELEIYFRKIENINNVCVLGIDTKGSQNQKIALVIEVPNHISDEQLNKVKDDIKIVGQNLPKKTKIDDVYLSMGKLPLANNMKVKRFVVKKAIESKSNDYVNMDAKKEMKTFEGFDQETMTSIVLPLRDMFSKILVLPKFKIEDNSHWINDLSGDSMNYVQLILEIQEKFNVKIPEEKYGQLTCINDFALEIANLKKNSK